MDEQLIRLLEDTAILMELADENAFKVNAFKAAARALETVTVNLAEAVENGTLTSLAGIGKGLQETIAEYVETGGLKVYEDLKQRVPDGVFAMTELRGLGAKKVRALWQELGIVSVAQLQTACTNGSVAALKGFGAKTQANILESIQQWNAAHERFHLHKAFDDGATLLARIRELPNVQQAELTGEARRFCETVASLHILVSSSNPRADSTAFALLSGFALVADSIALTGVSEHGIPTTVEFVEAAEVVEALKEPLQVAFVRRLHDTSCSDEYRSAFQALQQHVLLHGADVMITDERSLYAAVGREYVPPELRETVSILDDTTFSAEKLFTRADMRGILHVHSTWSDGKNSIREMAETARNMGCEYIAICDHSKSAFYANGLSEERIKRQHDEIDVLNTEGLGIRILKGIESDILADGALDYSDAVLDTFDMVVASVHSRFTMSREAQTARIVRALEHPRTTILGHPTGRLLLSRKEYALDIERVIEAAAAHGKILEINCNPYRLDLSYRTVTNARKHGVRFAVNTDAHNTRDLRYVDIGVGIARKADLQAADVINSWSVADFCIFADSTKTINH